MPSTLAIRADNIDAYMAEVRRYDLLTPSEEIELAHRYHDKGDVQAAHRLVVANLRFVVKVAHQYKGYGLRLLDLIQEGNVGLMIAVKKFDPKRGYRLISYAVWWIRASIQNFILRSWSLVRMGVSRTQRKLFFRLRGELARAARQAAGDPSPTQTIAQNLGVGEADVVDMQARLAARDFSLDASLGENGKSTHLDSVVAHEPGPEETLQRLEEQELSHRMVQDTWPRLNDKERYILEQRFLNDMPATLQTIGDTLGVSRERVRQLEKRILAKLRDTYQGMQAVNC